MSDLKDDDLVAGIVDEITISATTLTGSIPVVMAGEFLGLV
jgi:hypothetical protein